MIILKKIFLIVTVLMLSISMLLVNIIPVSASVTSYGKWANRTQTIYVSTTGTDWISWNSGAAKWRNNTNFNVFSTLGISSIYYAYDVDNPSVTWDGLASCYVVSKVIQDCTMNLNKYFTGHSKYTAGVKAGLAGHEVGHSLGLNHSSVVETTSIMHPYTFDSNDAPLRALNPSTSDITFVNNLYPVFPTASSESVTNITSKEDGFYLHPSWAVYYEDEEALEKAADLVVKGIVSNEMGSKFEKRDYTTYSNEVSVEISEVLKGELSQIRQKIIVSQMGGTDGEVTVYSDFTTHLKLNQEVILFLRKGDNNIYRPINEDDSIFVKEEGVFKNIASNKELNGGFW